MTTKEEALHFHEFPIPGKIAIAPTKPCQTQRDLSLAYTPGVAEPCRHIAEEPDASYRYTAKGNLVAVITDGSAVLGLGNIGALAGKPVMEGKAVLFKRFAGIDVFDIELDCGSTEHFIETVKAMAPTFGGINLEDIAAPRCFEIEQRLVDELEIPVFHDDQHGTAIITCAALINALELQNKKIEDVSVIVGGAGAAAIAITKLAMVMGLQRENITLVDSRGVVHDGRENLGPHKAEFARATDARTLADAMEGADVFVGVSVGGTVTQDMVRSMAEKPIIMALANPDPEITYPDACAARDDVIMATGRSDYPNQVNNVLGFPFIFRGALDVRARKISDGMKLAASKALAQMAREPVPEQVLRAYGIDSLEFGPEYIIPKPFDPRGLIRVAAAVARAAVDEGLARQPISDWDAYRQRLAALQGPSYAVIEPLRLEARRSHRRIALAEGRNPKIIRAAAVLRDEQICHPVLIGREERIRSVAAQVGVELNGIEIHDWERANLREEYARKLWQLRERKGVNQRMARLHMRDRNYYTAMMLHEGVVDGMVSGLTTSYSSVVRPALQVLGTDHPGGVVSGVYAMAFENRVLFFGDCTVNITPTPEQLVSIAFNTAKVARLFGIDPRVAFLSFSNFGDAPHERSKKVQKAVSILRGFSPDFQFDGEMQANVALDADLREQLYPFAKLEGEPTVLVFPDLQSGNIAYKLLSSLGSATAIGPILVGIAKPVTALQMGCDVDTIVDMVTVTACEMRG